MKKQILFGLLAAGMLAACSSDDSLSENNQYNMVEGQPAFISLGIAMPGNPQASRANDDFNDGVETEYAVNSGKLVLFKGTTEADAKLFASYDIPTTVTFSKETTAPQITSTSAKYVQEITSPGLTSGQKLFAYVILNSTGNATGIDYTSGTSWTDFSNAAFKAIGIKTESSGHGVMNDNGLVMTNVPLSTARGGDNEPVSAEIKTLAEIDPTSIYETQEAAAAATKSTCIYVERAAAKVDVTFATSAKSPNGTTATLTGWSLGNVNTTYYNTRQFDTNWSKYKNVMNTEGTTLHRFICGSALAPTKPEDTGHDLRYRTYFGKDVNYTTSDLSTTPLKNTKITEYPYTTSPAYTYENTFDQNSQTYQNTTFVGMKVALNGGTDFFTIGSDKKTMYNEATAIAKVKELATAQCTPYISTLTDEIAALITTSLADPTSELRTTAGCDASSKISFLIRTVCDDFDTPDADKKCDYDVYLMVTSTAVTGAGDPTKIRTAINNLTYSGTTTVQDKLEEALTFTKEDVYFYDDGVAYYAVRIAHFGDYETPWSAPTSAYNNYDLIYPSSGTSSHVSPETSVTYGADRANAWLGRWGVVRNNWYSLEVTNISAVGSATPVDFSADVTPDDNTESFYISAHIHILPWVKRGQSVILK